MRASAEFNPLTDVRFRGRPIEKLDRDELLDALVQALWRLRELEEPHEHQVYTPAAPKSLEAAVRGR